MTAYNPWARLIELNSTHPLTGMRIAHLGDIAKQKGQPFARLRHRRRRPRACVSTAARCGRQFWRELGILLAPGRGGASSWASLGAWPLAPAAFAATVEVCSAQSRPDAVGGDQRAAEEARRAIQFDGDAVHGLPGDVTAAPIGCG